ncbi:MAG: GntR family transcriptional regulator, partial [Hyphomicrobiales bacterium]
MILGNDKRISPLLSRTVILVSQLCPLICPQPGSTARGPLRDQIYPIVKMLILTGAIRPGDIIDEKNIAAQLNVSRTPVREAVKRLSDEHLVEVIAQSATRAVRI